MQAPHAPTSGDKIDLRAVNGSLLYITVKGVQRDIVTDFGTTDAVSCDVAILDGEQKGTVLEDTLIFPKVLQSQLAQSAGSADPVVVGRLGQGLAKPGKSAPWVLNTPTEADLAIATKYEAYAATKAAEQESPF